MITIGAGWRVWGGGGYWEREIKYMSCQLSMKCAFLTWAVSETSLYIINLMLVQRLRFTETRKSRETYCQSSWCPPLTPDEGQTRLFVSAKCSSPALWRMSAASPRTLPLVVEAQKNSPLSRHDFHQWCFLLHQTADLILKKKAKCSFKYLMARRNCQDDLLKFTTCQTLKKASTWWIATLSPWGGSRWYLDH